MPNGQCRRSIGEAEFLEAVELQALLSNFELTAFRLEAQPKYAVTEEREAFEGFVAGAPRPPSEYAWWQEWLDMIRDLNRRGRRIERVRVLAEPPSDYQRWECWGDRWHGEAGEHISYLPRSEALAAGLPLEDWWLFDSSRLVLMQFNAEGTLTASELNTEPETVSRYCELRELAIRRAPPACEYLPL
jgi:hypothetical protein